MIDNLNILAVIPARGGSKGIPLKNLKKVGGVPLVELAAQVASSIEFIDKTVVSTDSNKIADAAAKGGALVPFRRPEELSGDRVSDLQVLTHALNVMEQQDNKIYDVVIMLQPTSPLRVKKDVVDAIRMLIDGVYDSVWTVSETDSKSHPLKQLTVKGDKLEYYDNNGKDIIARQQLDPVYHRNGAAYVIRRHTLVENNSIMGINSGALILDGKHISIDTEEDLKKVNKVIHGLPT